MGTLQLKSGESKALPWTINLELETGRVAAGTDKDVVAVMDFISSEGLMSRVAHRVVELDEVLADPSRAVGMHPAAASPRRKPPTTCGHLVSDAVLSGGRWAPGR